MKLTSTTIFLLFFAFVGFGQESTNSAATAPTTDRDKAIEFYTLEDYKSAVPLFDKILTTDDNDWNSWLYFAMSLIKTGDSKNSAKAFKNALAAYPFKLLTEKIRPIKQPILRSLLTRALLIPI